MAATITLTTNAKLVARNGRTVHATAPNCQGVALCSPNMASKGYAPVMFMELKDENAQVTCKNCCRKLGVEAPKTLPVAKVAQKPAPAVVDAEVEANLERAMTMEWAVREVEFEGGQVMDHLHALAVRMYGWTKKGKAEARRAARKAR